MFFPRLGLRGNLILYGILGILLVLAILFRITTAAVEESTRALLRERTMLARSIAEEIEVPLQHALHTMEQTASTLKTLLAEAPQSSRKVLEALHSHFVDFHHFNVIAMVGYDAQGEVLEVVGAQRATRTGVYVRHPGVRQILDTRASLLASSIADGTRLPPYVLMGVPVTDPTGKVAGALAAIIDPIHPSVALGTVAQLAPQHYLVEIVDESGSIVAASRPELVGLPSPHAGVIAPALREHTSGTVIHEEKQQNGHEGVSDHTVAFARLPTLHWVLLIEQAEDAALAFSQHLQGWFVVLGGLATVTIVTLGWIIAHQILTPIGLLTIASQRIAGGDLEHAVDVPGRNEVSKLARSFEEMRVGLKASQEEIQRWNRELEDRVEQRTKELAALFEAARAITSVLDQEALIDIFLAKNRAIHPHASVAVLFLWDDSKEQLVPRGGFGIDRELVPILSSPWDQTVAGQVFAANRALIWRANEDGTVSDGVWLSQAVPRCGPVCCGVGIPLATQERRLGSVVMYAFSPSTCPTEHDLLVLQTLADQMAVALENARLFEEAKLVGRLRRLDAIKSEFVAWASHELRTPLASIKSLAETLLREDLLLPQEEQREFLATINRSCDRLARVLDELLTLSKIEAGQVEMRPTAFSLRPVVAKVVEQFRLQQSQHRFVIAVPRDLPPVWADPERVEDVLSNLLSNAAKYSTLRSRIGIAAHQADSPRAQDERGRARPVVIVSVVDQGVGIPSDALGRLFQRFFRADHPGGRKVAGSGLGLYITKTYVEGMGGTIWAESQEGKGATFSFSLPLANVPPLSRKALPAGNGRAAALLPSLAVTEHLREKYVLLVDDEPEVLRALDLELQANGVHTQIASNGGECLQRVSIQKPDAIVLDMVLPGGSGLEVARALRLHPDTCEIPIIMISARAQEQDVAVAVAEGARAYLRKPFSAVAVRDLLAGMLKPPEPGTPSVL